jgi:hypothetical protein
MRALLILGLLLTYLSSAATAFNIFEENGFVGLKNENGKIIIPAKYEKLGWSNETFSVIGNATGFRLQGKWGLIHIDAHHIIEATYVSLEPGEGHFLIAQNISTITRRPQFGCISTAGKTIIPFAYDGLIMSNMRWIALQRSNQHVNYGLLDSDHKILIPFQFKRIYPLGNLRFAAENFENTVSLYGDNGKAIAHFNVDSIAPFQKNFAITFYKSNKGLITREGIIKLEPKYREIEIDDSGKIQALQEDEWYFYDGNNTKLKTIIANSLQAVAKNKYVLFTNGMAQLVDEHLTPISIPFSSIGSFTNNRAVFHDHGKAGILQLDGTLIVPANFDSIYTSGSAYLGMRHSAQKQTWTLISLEGNVLTQKPYESIEPIGEKYYRVRYRQHAGVIDYNGREIINCTYDSILQNKDNLMVVSFRGQQGIIDISESWKVTPRNAKLILLGNYRYLEITPTKTFLKSLDGNTIYFTENKLDVFPDHIIEHLSSGDFWKLDLNGRIIDRQIHPDKSVETVFIEHEGFRAIKKNGKYGFIDSQARLRIANRYDDVKPFSDGYAGIKLLGRWGYINKEDQITVQPIYDEVFPFIDGYARVKQRDHYGLINKQGKEILPCRYERIELLPTGNFIIQINNLYGLASTSGKILIQPRYSSLQDTGNTFAVVERDGKYGVVNHQSISTIPLMFDHITYDSFNNLFIVQKKSSFISMN